MNGAPNPGNVKPNGQNARRRSLLELAPLELDCMTALWLLGEGTVREIRESLAPRRPRAYTTIMTIMDRLAQKGIVERQRTGRAWKYRANLSKEDARAHAVAQVVENFFDGSMEALLAQMAAAKKNGADMNGLRPAPKDAANATATEEPVSVSLAGKTSL
ncbi:MAG TPA: BlaI/MecI/CopY family transcriptional regulator [Candidatus Acidoferrales bacterium]|nr:BlaI/MecI/CopY family transcriptional regulator [Candidatus Acidoferrales bacterium]